MKMCRLLLSFETIFCLFNFVVGFDEAIDYACDPSVQLFQKYIQIDTTTYNELGPAVEFWQTLANAVGLTLEKYLYEERMPVLVIKWPGADPSLPSVMLNSHVDVVPAHEEDGWTYPPFSGHLSEDGKIYGRGTQDMKPVSIQYYEALKRIKSNNITLMRDIYMTLMPDEEVGAEAGMIPFLQSDEFKAMRVGIALDEGGAVPLPLIPLIYQDKVVWQLRVDCHGVAGHGSSLPPTNSTATGKCRNVIDNLFAFREEQYAVYAATPLNDAGAYTSVNLNKMSAGTANNVIPNLVSLTFDIRPSTRLDEDEFTLQLENMILSAGDDIDITYILKNPQSVATVANSSNPYWTAIADAAHDLNLTLLPAVAPGSTDARHVRMVGIPAFGVSPQPSTPSLMHAVNEYITAATFLSGIDFYERVIYNLANVPEDGADPSSYLYRTTE